MMKIWATILLLNITFFLVQPVFAHESKDACVKSCCPESSRNKKDCPENCNPLFMCMYCQYVVTNKAEIVHTDHAIAIEYGIDITGNIADGYIDDCWHPPGV